VLRGAERARHVGPVRTQRKQDGAEQNDQAGFDERGPVLQIGTLARAPDVDGGDDGDHHQRHDGGAGRGEWNDFGEIAREGASQRGDAAAGDYRKQAPAVEEGWETPESVADVAVEAAGFGIACGELRISEGADEGQDAADDPDEERESHGTVELAKDQTRSKKNAGANHRTDEKQEEIALRERAEEWGHFWCGEEDDRRVFQGVVEKEERSGEK